MRAKDGDGETLSSLDGPAAESAPDPDFPVVDPRFYDFTEEIARGGWGRILRAFDRRLGRMVAIKQLRASSDLVESRLRREACLTARLEHPAIVPVHEVGRWPSGEPFYAMKLVEGRSLQEVIDAAPSLDERLPLLPHVLAVADAMAYAHAKRVIHRDLKPSNVMIGAFGETLVIDWGLAKDVGEENVAVDGPDDGSPQLTLAGSVIGTPPYLSPEQARGEPADERADVYAIGAMLYTLVTGHGPYDGTSADEIIRRVVAGPVVPVTRWQPTAPRDLVAVVAKAMARDPRQRYGSARELAEDLRRFLSGQLVAAQSYSTPVLVARWLRAHRRGVATGAVLLVLAVALLVGGGRLRQQQAVAAAREAELILMRAREELDRDPTTAVALLKRYALADSADQDDIALVAAEADSRLVARHVFREMRGASIAADGKTVAGFDGPRVRLFRTDTGELRELVDPDGEVTLLRFAPDGARFATIDGASLRVWDVASGGSQRLMHSERHLYWFDWSGDGRFIAVTNDAGRVDRVDLTSGAVLERGGGEGVAMPWFSRDGHHLAVTSSASVQLFHDDAPEALVLPPPGGDWLAFAPDGQRLAWCTRQGEVRLYDLVRGAMRVVGNHGAQVARVEFTPDGSRLASAGADGSVRLWDLRSGAVQVLAWPGEAAAKLALSRDGALLAVGGLKGPVRVWDLATGLARTLRGHTHEIRRLQFSGDGKTLVSSDHAGEARVWALAPAPALPVARRMEAAGFGAGGSLVALSSGNGIDVWDAATGALRRIDLPSNPGPLLVVSPDGRHAATAAGSRVLAVDLVGGGVSSLAANVTMRALALAPDGRTIAVSGDENQILLVPAAGGEPERKLRGHATVVQLLRFSPDGRRLLSAALDGVRLWPLDGSRPDGFSPGEVVTEASFAPDGRRVALVGASGRAWLWTPGQAGPRTLSGGGARINRLAFAPDGRILASAGDDRVVWLWDSATGRRRGLPHSAAVSSVAFIGDGSRLASAASDGAVRLWDVASGRELSVLHVADDPLEDVFSMGGALVAIDAGHVWRVTLPTSAPASLGGLTTAELRDDGVLSTPGAAKAPPP